MNRRHSLVTKVSVVIIAFLLVVNSISSLWIYKQITTDAKNQIERQIKATLYGISANIDGDRVQAIINQEPEAKVDYEMLNTYLNRCLKTGDFKYLYTVCKQADESFVYCVDGALPTDVDYVAYGTPLELTADMGTTFVEKALKEGTAFTPVQYFEQWGNLITGYVAIYNSRHEAVALLAIDLIASDYYTRINHLNYQVWGTLGIATLATGILLVMALVYTLKPVGRIKEAVGEIAKGNMQEQLEIKRKDEIGAIAKAINQMTEQLSTTIGMMGTSAQKVMQAAESLVEQSEEVEKASHLVTEESQAIRMQSEEDQISLSDIKELMEGMEEKVEGITSKSDVLREGVQSSYEYAKKGSSHVFETTQHIRQSSQAMGEAAQQVGGLQKQVIEAMKLVELIGQIAHRTRILGLNASIESAKQGSKGFGVIAHEIDDLAQESSKVADQTKELLEGVRAYSTQVVGRITTLNQGMEAVAQGADQMAHYFTGILEATKEMKSCADAVNDAMKGYTEDNKEVLGQIEQAQVHALSLLDNCQHIAAFTQEQFATAEQMLAYAQALKVLAKTLELGVSTFKVK